MITCFEVQQLQLLGNFQQEKLRNLSGKWKQESMIWDKMGCISGCMVKSNLVIYLVPYLLHYRHLNTGHLYNDFDWIDLIWKKCPVSREHPHKHSVHHETSTRLTLIFNTQTSSSFGIDKNYFRDMLKLGYSITFNFVEDLNLLKP